VAAGPEAHPLPRVLGVGLPIEVLGLEPGDVDQHLGGGGLAGERMESHFPSFSSAAKSTSSVRLQPPMIRVRRPFIECGLRTGAVRA
jgi:hypothetical protein